MPHITVGSGLKALRYLAPHIFRVAINNNHILKLADGKVTFRHRTSDTGKIRVCTLAAEEFIRRLPGANSPPPAPPYARLPDQAFLCVDLTRGFVLE